MNHSSAVRNVLTVPLCLLLIACSGEPTEADIRRIYEAQIAKSNEQMVRMGGEEAANLLGKSELHAITRLGCKEAREKSGYNCDVEVDMSVPFLGRSTQTHTRRFVKADDGWVVIEH